MSADWVMDRYRRFADTEAAGRSAVYAAWAARVADDRALAEVIAALPDQRRQPPLVFAALRMLGADDTGCDEAAVEVWAAFVLAHAEPLADFVAEHSLQTNEPLRCAALLPALTLIDGPIALVELGAAAGLCLFPDRYAYRFASAQDPGRTHALAPVDGSAVQLASTLRGADPALRLPEIVWRAGSDIAPLDARSAHDRAWLLALVWPGEDGRAERIGAALDVAAAEPAPMLAGDAAATLDELVRMAGEAAPHATIVVSTMGVLPYLPRAEREALIVRIQAMPVRWVTLDAPGLHSAFTGPIDRVSDGFALALDGEVLAAADPLGAWIDWFAR